MCRSVALQNSAFFSALAAAATAALLLTTIDGLMTRAGCVTKEGDGERSGGVMTGVADDTAEARVCGSGAARVATRTSGVASPEALWMGAGTGVGVSASGVESKCCASPLSECTRTTGASSRPVGLAKADNVAESVSVMAPSAAARSFGGVPVGDATTVADDADDARLSSSSFANRSLSPAGVFHQLLTLPLDELELDVWSGSFGKKIGARSPSFLFQKRKLSNRRRSRR